ncbi:MAG TPA: PPC domain-containing protein, partial [Aestuariivirgaceae bacterium]|nr:PPC domain-containing protein [Aestuariivirgaceae bacterium]
MFLAVAATSIASAADLQNGVPVSGLSGATGAAVRYTFQVPAGSSNLRFQISGGSGDADLYVRFGNQPSLSAFDCRPYVDGNNETCVMPSATAGTWHVMVHGYAAFSGVTLVASYSTAPPPPSTTLQNGVPVSGLSGATGAQLRYTLEVPAGSSNLRFQISGGSGDADLYVRFGNQPSLSAFDCRPYVDGNN